jgi:DNA-binding CsgD family transcriptional regulator
MRKEKDFYGLLSPDGRLLYANEGSLDLLGAELKDVVGVPFWETAWFSYTPGMPEQIRGIARRVAETGKTEVADLRVTLPTGVIEVEYSMRPIFDEYGSLVALRPEGNRSVASHAINKREREVLAWIAQGKTAEETAIILGISRRTVEWHATNARNKIEASTIAHAVAKAMKHGVIGVVGAGMGGVGVAAALESPILRKFFRDLSEVVLLIV